MTLTQTLAIGDIRLSALRDGELSFVPSQFPDAPPDEVDGLMLQAGVSSLPSAINAYLIQVAGRTTLVDCGPRDLFGPGAGRLHTALAECGVAAADIDRIVITHLHGDHIAGAVDASGDAVFGNAELCVHQADDDHYTSDINRARAPDASRRGFDLARQVIDAYGARYTTYTDNTDFGHGVFAMPLPGHTPGHAGLRLDSGGDAVLLVADIVHCQLLQLGRPEWGTVFDVDRDRAAATRARLLDQLASERVLFSGSHFERHPLGYLVRGLQGYRFEALGD